MAEALWTLEALVAATGGTVRGTPPASFSGVEIDSRSCKRGDIFFAIHGVSMDGHRFVTNAFDAEADLAVVSDPTRDMEAAGPLLVVPDTLAALGQLGVAARRRSRARIAAITGSVGKTGTKEALRLCLAGQGKVHASAASFNNHWGVPLTLARMPRDADWGVFEVGMNHPGEITPLAAMIAPHVAVVTNVEAVHLGAFARVEEIADAKAEIFTGLEPGGAAILNFDNPHYKRLRAAAKAAGVARIVRFGERAGADAHLVTSKLRDDGSCVRAAVCGHDVTYKIGAPGGHIVMNSLAVLAAAVELGADLALAALALGGLRAVKGRGARHLLAMRGGTATLLDESYNANPTSMRAALALLGMQQRGPAGRRIAVLGDMLELGEDADALHAGLAASIDEADVDLVFACGPHMAALWQDLPAERRGGYSQTADGLRDALVEAVRAGDAVMVKGSLGSRMGPLVETLLDTYPPRAAA